MTNPRDGLDDAIDDMGWPFLSMLVVLVAVSYVVTSPWRLYDAVKARTARA